MKFEDFKKIPKMGFLDFDSENGMRSEKPNFGCLLILKSIVGHLEKAMSSDVIQNLGLLRC